MRKNKWLNHLINVYLIVIDLVEDNSSDNSREISIAGQSCLNLETDSELARLKHYIQSLEATLRRYPNI